MNITFSDSDKESKVEPAPTDTTKLRMESFVKELEQLINKYSMENLSDTPDFILAQHLLDY
jgi:hypothetical protein